MASTKYWAAALLVGIAAAYLSAQTTRPAGPTTAPSTQPAAPATQPVRSSFGDPEEIEKLLASSDWHVRRQTQDKLVRGGEEARPFVLDLINRATNPEARKNAQAALVEIDENRRLGTSYITLHVKDASAADVFAQMSRQCFASLQTFPDNLFQQQTFPHATLDIDKEPFWQAMPEVCAKFGLSYRPCQNGLRIMAGVMQGEGISTIQGPFLIVANQVSFMRTRMFGANAEQSQFGMNLSVYPEPKLAVVRTAGGINVDKVIDDHGNSLVPTGRDQMRMFGGFGGIGAWNVYAPMDYPHKNPGTRIVRFQGSMGFVVQTDSEKIELRDLQNVRHSSRVINGLKVTFEDMKKVGDAWQLHIHIDQPNFAGAEWQEFIEGVQNRMQILDAAGNRLDQRGMSTSAGGNVVDVELNFARGNRPDGSVTGDPARLVWEVPTQTRTLSVPVEFKDLPLFDQN